MIRDELEGLEALEGLTISFEMGASEEFGAIELAQCGLRYE